MLKIDSVCKSFGHVNVLNNISFEISKGEIVGFLGRNGAGKTTLMRILTTYILPTSGTVSIDGLDVAKDAIKVRKKIGYLPENIPLYEYMNVREYLVFAAKLKDLRGLSVNKEVERVLDECDLKKVRNQTIQYLSKGFKQRIGIAQAIIHRPELIILDEPTNGLDPIQVAHVRRLINKLKENHTIIISTHILSEIEQLASRIILIKDGRVAKDESLQLMIAESEHSSLQEIFISIHS